MSAKLYIQELLKEYIVGTRSGYILDSDIDDIILFLENAKQDGATRLKWKGDICDNSLEDLTINPYYLRLETDSETLARIAKHDAHKAWEEGRRLDKERKEYERLKKKFENG